MAGNTQNLSSNPGTFYPAFQSQLSNHSTNSSLDSMGSVQSKWLLFFKTVPLNLYNHTIGLLQTRKKLTPLDQQSLHFHRLVERIVSLAENHFSPPSNRLSKENIEEMYNLYSSLLHALSQIQQRNVNEIDILGIYNLLLKKMTKSCHQQFFDQIDQFQAEQLVCPEKIISAEFLENILTHFPDLMETLHQHSPYQKNDAIQKYLYQALDVNPDTTNILMDLLEAYYAEYDAVEEKFLRIQTIKVQINDLISGLFQLTHSDPKQYFQLNSCKGVPLVDVFSKEEINSITATYNWFLRLKSCINRENDFHQKLDVLNKEYQEIKNELIKPRQITLKTAYLFLKLLPEDNYKIRLMHFFCKKVNSFSTIFNSLLETEKHGVINKVITLDPIDQEVCLLKQTASLKADDINHYNKMILNEQNLLQLDLAINEDLKSKIAEIDREISKELYTTSSLLFLFVSKRKDIESCNRVTNLNIEKTSLVSTSAKLQNKILFRTNKIYDYVQNLEKIKKEFENIQKKLDALLKKQEETVTECDKLVSNELEKMLRLRGGFYVQFTDLVQFKDFPLPESLFTQLILTAAQNENDRENLETQIAVLIKATQGLPAEKGQLIRNRPPCPYLDYDPKALEVTFISDSYFQQEQETRLEQAFSRRHTDLEKMKAEATIRFIQQIMKGIVRYDLENVNQIRRQNSAFSRLSSFSHQLDGRLRAFEAERSRLGKTIVK